MKNSLLSVLTGVVFAALAAAGQAPAGPKFEVASVKASPIDLMQLAQQVAAGGSLPKMGPRVDGARADYSFMSIKELIVEAYKVKPFQITGPDWLNATAAQRFDIQAKLPEGASKEQAPEMLQALLAERFKLVAHRETKDRAVLALVVGKDGPKLKPATDVAADIDPNIPLKPGETQIDTGQGIARVATDRATGTSTIDMGKRGKMTMKMSAEGIHMSGMSVTMSAFADMLSQLTRLSGGNGPQVVDMTGITGNYLVEFDIPMADLLNIARSMGAAVPNTQGNSQSPGEAASDPGGSGLSKTVQAMGLKLEQRRSPTEQLIVDRVEKTPTEN